MVKGVSIPAATGPSGPGALPYTVILCLVLQQVKAHLYVRRFQKINIIFCRYHKYKTSILSILWEKEKGRKEGGNTEHDLNVVSGIQLSNQFKPPI